MNRRDFIVGATAFAGGQVVASPVKSLMGAGSTKYIAKADTFDNPYIHDSLVCMWDGEWSDGGDGRLLDLSGNRHHAIGNFVFSADTLSFTGRGETDGSFPYAKMEFVEFVVRREDSVAEQMLLVGGGNKYNFAFAGYPGICRGSGYGCSVKMGGYERAAAYFDMPNKKAWKNGVLQTTTGTNSMSQTSAKMQIGRYTPRDNYPFKGVWYSVRIHSRVLTESEIASNYAIDKERFGL